jgi:autotransporter-associated beta strand protein
MMRIRREHALALSLAILGALPARRTFAGPAITSFYIEGQIASNSSFTTNLQSVPVSAANPTVVVPVGSYFRFGVSTIITGNPNSTAGDAWDLANQAQGNPAQPANLGLGSIEYQVGSTDTNATKLAPVLGLQMSPGVNDYYSTANVPGPAVLPDPGDVMQGNGWVGLTSEISYTVISAAVNVNTADGIAQLAYFGGASATPAQASIGFDQLAYHAVSSGLVGLQAQVDANNTYYIHANTPGTVGGSDATYQQDLINGYASVNALPVLAVVTSPLLIWDGHADHTTWNTAAANWNNGSSSSSTYSDGQIAQFDDTAPANSTSIALNTSVAPSELLVLSNTNNFVFTGTGGFTGTGMLLKQGTSTFTLATNNTYSGTTGITAGVLQVGNGGSTGTLGTGEVVDDASLVFDLTGSHTISNFISGTGSLIQIGTGTIALTGQNTYSGPTVVSNGTLLVNATSSLPSSTSVTVTGSGAFKFSSNLGAQTVTSLAVGNTANFDLANNHLFIDYGSGADPATSIVALLRSGFNGAAWNGHGIASSTAASTSGYGVGFYDSAFGSIPGLSSGQIELKYTLYGDITLQGTVNGADFAILAANFGKSVTGGWEQGDFNYDGTVNASDFALLAANFGKSDTGAATVLPASEWTALDSFAASNNILADLPEPASFALIVPIAGLLSLRCRRVPRR